MRSTTPQRVARRHGATASYYRDCTTMSGQPASGLAGHRPGSRLSAPAPPVTVAAIRRPPPYASRWRVTPGRAGRLRLPGRSPTLCRRSSARWSLKFSVLRVNRRPTAGTPPPRRCPTLRLAPSRARPARGAGSWVPPRRPAPRIGGSPTTRSAPGSWHASAARKPLTDRTAPRSTRTRPLAAAASKLGLADTAQPSMQPAAAANRA